MIYNIDNIYEVLEDIKKELKTLNETMKKSGNLLDKVADDTKDILMDLDIIETQMTKK